VRYAGAVLDILGIAGLFDDVVSIEHTRFRPKPDSYGFLRLVARHRLRADRCIMVEDSLDNLRTAKRLGMTTVWVTRSARRPGYVDAAVRNVLDLRRIAPQLG
jgi:putative hydrolase of the HAD superfamily